MTLKKMFLLLFAASFILPLSIFAFDDFDDDFGDFEESEDKGSSDDFDAEESAARKKEKDQEASEAAMKDLLGEEEESFTEEKKEKPEKEKSKKENDITLEKEQPKKEKKKAEPKEKGLKPVILVKGGFTVLGQYQEVPAGKTKPATYGSMFGSVDEGLIGAEFIGDHVIAKGTMNVRTKNPLLEKRNNPLAKANLHSIQDGFYNGLYEVYGGLRFFDVFIKAGKMLPEYGLIDTYQNIGMGFTTPFLTRSLVAVEGYIPETDEGFALGYKGTFANEHTIFAGFMLGSGSVASKHWKLDKVMGIYGRLGYMHEYFQGAFGFQYRTDYFNEKVNGKDTVKNISFLGIGVHLKASVAGFEMPLTFDFNQFDLIQTQNGNLKKGLQNILLSLAPGYAYSFDSEWADKIGLAIRFDLIRGVYTKGVANYLEYGVGTANATGTDSVNYAGYKQEGVVFRIGATLNFFAKDIKGVRSFAGLTFLMQPEQKIVAKSSKNKINSEFDYGFTTIMLSAGAEM